MWIIFKVFIEIVTILLLVYVLVFWLQGKWDFNLGGFKAEPGVQDGSFI